MNTAAAWTTAAGRTVELLDLGSFWVRVAPLSLPNPEADWAGYPAFQDRDRGGRRRRRRPDGESPTHPA